MAEVVPETNGQEATVGRLEMGDTVKWSSQARGRWKDKDGYVIAVVPAGEQPSRYVPNGFALDVITKVPRDHESYLVRAGRGRRLYWPRVHLLEKTTGGARGN